MLQDDTQFNQLGVKLFTHGILDDFEKKNGPIKGRMMVTEGKIPPNMLKKLQPELLKNPRWLVVQGSFDFSDYMIGMVVGLNPVKPLSEGWLIPQSKNPGVELPKQWQEFFMRKVINAIDENGHIDLPMFSWISDRNDLTKTVKDL